MHRIVWVALAAALVVLVASSASAEESAPNDPTAATAPAEPAAEPAPLRNGCSRLYSHTLFASYIEAVYLRADVSPRALSKIDVMRRCQKTGYFERWAKKKQRLVSRARWIRLHYWEHEFSKLPAAGRAWARSTSSCESGNRQIAREGGFLSYFQWVLSTWHMAGGSGNPENVGWYEQAVRAWRWHVKVPRGQWPNCGE